jgi:hypothetical protein
MVPEHLQGVIIGLSGWASSLRHILQTNPELLCLLNLTSSIGNSLIHGSHTITYKVFLLAPKSLCCSS